MELIRGGMRGSYQGSEGNLSVVDEGAYHGKKDLAKYKTKLIKKWINKNNIIFLKLSKLKTYILIIFYLYLQSFIY